MADSVGGGAAGMLVIFCCHPYQTILWKEIFHVCGQAIKTANEWTYVIQQRHNLGLRQPWWIWWSP